MEAIGDLLPVAVAAALSPFPIAGVILVLGSSHGRVSGPAFALGWVVALSLLTFVLILAARGAEAGYHGTGPWLQIVVGVGLLGAAARKWRRRPRKGEPVQPPAWMSAFGEAGPGRAMMLGAALGGANPKNIALALGAASSIAGHGLSAPGALAAGLVFVLVASSTVIGAVLMHLYGGRSSARSLSSLQQFMLRNNNVILMVVFVLIGVKILGDGLSELAQS